MRTKTLSTFLAAALASSALIGCGVESESALGLDNDPPLSDRDDVLAGAPDPDSIPSNYKADEILPTRYSDLIATQSPVKSQARRGVCSIFATVGLMEHLYITKGVAETPDFSEQYLQWLIKHEYNAFPGSSGSNGSVNLAAIHEMGIPVEAAWPYEADQWNSTNDAECTGTDPQPMKCYTNGDPSESALAAEKFFLPENRFLSRRDIKAHLFTKHTGVIVGFDFFYQSWNHRKSTLPTNAGYWDEGYVLYPNAKDRQVSLATRAGHAIVLIGWDDELEVPTVDENGAQVLDAQGNPVVEKGFYLFKNSWGTAGFGIRNEFGAGYGWISQRYIHEFASAQISDLPVIASSEVCGDGLDNDNNGAIDCSDVACASDTSCQTSNVTTVQGVGNLSIPDNDSNGITSVARAETSGVVAGIKVSVDITHSFRGDLRVSLVHDGVTVRLANGEGGSAHDLVKTFEVAGFDGAEVQGDWTLVVSDVISQDVGILNGWSAAITVK